jgi:hypothetical protein
LLELLDVRRLGRVVFVPLVHQAMWRSAVLAAQQAWVPKAPQLARLIEVVQRAKLLQVEEQ